MRDIRFRVWSKQAKCWTRDLKFDDQFVSEKFPVKSLFARDCLVQQSTGLKDKNGREIYEGDIVKYNNLNYEVSWGDSEWKALCSYYRKYHHWPSIAPFGYIRSGEIVGNIFENPELLKYREL